MQNNASHLKDKHCVPCKGGKAPLTKEQYKPMLEEVKDWKVKEDKSLEKTFKFKDFKESLSFVNKVGEIAGNEQHHPDINLHGWNKVTITLSTHVIDGLSENDFILASKLNEL